MVTPAFPSHLSLHLSLLQLTPELTPELTPKKAHACAALSRIARGGAACAAAVVNAGGVVAAVAAMRAWPNNVDVSAAGCAMMLDVRC